MMEDFSIPETSDGGSYPWQRVGRFEIRLCWKSCGRRSSRSTFNFLFNTTRARATQRWGLLSQVTMYIAHGAARAPGRLIRVRIQVSLARSWGTLERPRPPRRAPRGFERLGTKRARCPGHP